MREWTTEADLAAILLKRANERRGVRLTHETALFIGLKLMTASVKPTRDEIARIICTYKCAELCFTCTGKANEIVQAYGHRVDECMRDG